MRLAVIGLAYSHPFTYSAILQRWGSQITHVWDEDDAQARRFAERFGARLADTPERAIEDVPDGVIVTSRGSLRTDHALLAIERGIPTYIGKPMAASVEDWSRLQAAIHRTGCAVMSTSVLRYAPAVQSLRARLATGQVGTLLTARATAVHSIEMYLHEPNRWQDDIHDGGGSILTMGVHALDPLMVLLGRGVESVYCETAVRHFEQTRSEDVALITLRWRNGLRATAEIVGAFGGEYYGVEIYGSERILRTQMPRASVVDHLGTALGDADPWVEYGYVGTMETFLDMCRTRRSPIPLAETEEVLAALLAARLSSRRGKPVALTSLRVPESSAAPDTGATSAPGGEGSRA